MNDQKIVRIKDLTKQKNPLYSIFNLSVDEF